MSDTSAQTAGHDLLTKLTKMKEKTISLNGNSGFFLSKKGMATIEDTLHTLMKEGNTSVSPTVLIEMQDIINDLRSKADAAEARLNATEKHRKALAGNLEDAQKDLKAAQESHDKERKDILSQKSKLQDELKQVNSFLATAKKQPTLPEEVESAVSDKKKLQADLEEKNALLKISQDEVNLLHKRVNALKLETSNAELLKPEILKQAWKQPTLEEIEDVPDSSALLKKTMQGELRKHVYAAALAKQASVREFAFKTMELASKSDPRNFVGYKEYSQAVFNLVKDKSHAQRKKYFPLVDALFSSMAHAKGPTFNTVKQMYAEIFTPTPEIKEKTKEREKAKKQSWFDAFKLDFWIWKTTWRIRVKETCASIKSFFTFW